MPKRDKKMVITVKQLRDIRVRSAGKPLTPVGGAIRPKKGGSYSRAREKDRARSEDC